MQLRFDAELLILGIVLITMIVAACVVVVRVRRMRHEEAAPLSQGELIQSFQALVERGELDPREFERIKERLAQQEADHPPP